MARYLVRPGTTLDRAQRRALADLPWPRAFRTRHLEDYLAFSGATAGVMAIAALLGLPLPAAGLAWLAVSIAVPAYWRRHRSRQDQLVRTLTRDGLLQVAPADSSSIETLTLARQAATRLPDGTREHEIARIDEACWSLATAYRDREALEAVVRSRLSSEQRAQWRAAVAANEYAITRLEHAAGALADDIADAVAGRTSTGADFAGTNVDPHELLGAYQDTLAVLSGRAAGADQRTTDVAARADADVRLPVIPQQPGRDAAADDTDGTPAGPMVIGPVDGRRAFSAWPHHDPQA